MAELTKTDKKQLDDSYEFGSKVIWECLEETKAKNLDSEAVGMEILYQVVQFLESKGWIAEDLENYVKNSFKDAIDNKLYQNALSKIKVEHRKAGELSDKERAILNREKKILKEGDYANLKEINSNEIDKTDNTIEVPSDINTDEVATA